MGGFEAKRCRVTVDSLTVEVEGVTILRDVSFEVDGGLTAFIGPNGAGKTTLLRVLAGILGHRGVVRVCGLDVRSARRISSYVPSFLQVDPYARVEDVIVAYLQGVSNPRSPEDVLESFGLARLRGRRFNSLSGGEHKLVLIAGALARNPSILLLDEPFSHLDLANQAKLARLLKAVSENLTVIAAVHEPFFASLADRVGILNSGRLIAFGSPGEVLRKNVLEEVYGVELEEVSLGSKTLVLPSL